jgi:tetratricopeptide (TPR) repeat protein
MALNACISPQSKDKPYSSKDETPSKALPKSTEPIKTIQKSKPSQTHSLEESVHSHFKNGDYPQALDTIANAVSQGMPEKSMEQDYVTALNGTLSLAQEFMSLKDYPQAGLLFQKAQMTYPKSQLLIRQINLSEKKIEGYIGTCSQELMEQGLAAYRSGQLDIAIDEWKKIIRFVPNHSAALKAIETAETQLSNLNSLEHRQPNTIN